jgi:hypothetical protein
MKLQLTYTKNQDGTEYLLCNEKDNFYHLPLNNAPTLEGVHLLPPLEDGLFGLGMKEMSTLIMYTEEDLRKAIDMARKFPYIKWHTKNNGNFVKKGEVKFDTPIEKIIQSLQKQKYPVAFECEMVDKGEEDWIGDDITGEPFWNQKLEPKTIINSQLTKLVGKYIY